MSAGTIWYAATDEQAELLVTDESESSIASEWLQGVAEVDLFALGELLEAPYEPLLVLEDDGAMVLRVNEAFLRAVGVLEEPRRHSIATAWNEAIEGALDPITAVSRLEAMSRFARAALEGPGVLAVPLV